VAVIRLFDFDGTLFRNPGPPADWPGEDYTWYDDPVSLLPPAVPLFPGLEWWVGPSVEAARHAFAPDRDLDMAFLATGRTPTHKERIRELVNQVGIAVPTVHCRPEDEETVPFKIGVLERGIDSGTELVEVWDDMQHYLDAYREFVEGELGLPFVGHLVRYPQPAPGGYGLAASRVASRYLFP